MSKILRELDLAESTFWLLDRASSMNFAVYADGTGSPNPESIRKGLNWIQEQHPMLRISILHDMENGLKFSEVEPEKLPEVSFRNEDLINADNNTTAFNQSVADAIMEPFENECPLMRCGLLRSQGTFRLYLIFHHSIADGRSGLKLLEQLFQRISDQPIDAKSSANVAPSEEGINSGFPAGLHERLQAPETEPVMEPNPARPISLFQKRKGPATARLEEVQIQAEQLKTLRRTGKEKGATLHGVLGACLLEALANVDLKYSSDNSTRETENADSSNRMALASPADMRSSVRSESPAEELALYISLITTTVDVPVLQEHTAASESFWELARTISKDVHSQLKSNPLDFYRLLPQPARYLGKSDPGKAYGALIQRLPQALAFSNAGVVGSLAASHNQDWKVTNVTFTVHPSVSQVMFVAATTYEDRLTLTLHIDSARWPRGLMESFLDELQGILGTVSAKG